MKKIILIILLFIIIVLAGCRTQPDKKQNVVFEKTSIEKEKIVDIENTDRYGYTVDEYQNLLGVKLYDNKADLKITPYRESIKLSKVTFSKINLKVTLSQVNNTFVT